MQVLILCGGLGNRLRPLTDKIPKPMVLIDGRPFLEYLINLLKKQGVNDIIMAAGYKAEMIKDYFGEGSAFGVKIRYTVEEELLGTAGAIRKARDLLDNQFVVINGDTYLDIDVNRLVSFHEASGGKVTMALIEVEDVSRYGSVVVDEQNKVVAFEEKKDISEKGLINTGYYVLNKEILDQIPADTKCSLEKEIFPLTNIKGYKCKGYFVDIGTFESYEMFKKEFKAVVK